MVTGRGPKDEKGNYREVNPFLEPEMEFDSPLCTLIMNMISEKPWDRPSFKKIIRMVSEPSLTRM
jgi:hypothetical protein